MVVITENEKELQWSESFWNTLQMAEGTLFDVGFPLLIYFMHT